MNKKNFIAIFIFGLLAAWSAQASADVSVDGNIAVIGAYGYDSYTGAAYVFTRSGNNWILEEAKLTVSDATNDWSSYNSVSVSGDTVIVGATSTRKAYVFVRSGSSWTEQAILFPKSSTPSYFGSSVAVEDDTAVITANGNDSFWVFMRSSGIWTQEAKLTVTGITSGDQFGNAVSMDGDTVIVAAYGEDSFTGAVYVFTRSGGVWTQKAKLTADDGNTNNYFGESVSVSGDTVVIGTRADAAYVFTRSNGVWSQEQKLTGTGVDSGDRFGKSVSIAGDTMIIGAGADKEIAINAGAAYVFTRSGGVWTQKRKFIASDTAGSNHFGSHVAFDGTTAVIGASVPDSSTDIAYAFNLECGWGRDLPANTWLMTAPSCTPSPTGINDQYGTDLGGTYGTNWISFNWLTGTQAYNQQAGTDSLALGVGNWNYSYNAGPLILSGTVTHTEDCSAYGWSGQTCHAIDLTHAPDNSTDIWQLVGHPFPYTVDWADVRIAVDSGSGWTVYNPSEAETAGYISKTYYTWNGGSYDSYDDNTIGAEGTLQSQEAIWLRILSGSLGLGADNFKLLIPAN